MTYEVRSAFSGLFTNVAETKAPAEALRVADNVVIRQPGAVEPRQGFEPYTVPFSLSGVNLTQAQAHGPDMVYETSGQWRAKDGTVRKLVLWPLQSAADLQKYRADSFAVAFARGNMYVPHKYGVAAASSASATTWRNAGLAQNFMTGLVAGAGTVASPKGLAPLSQWSYRVVAKKTDANGLITRSAPTGAENVRNLSAVNYVQVQVPPQVWGSAFWDSNPDEVEIYRTRTFPNAITVDDNMALVATMKVDATGNVVAPGFPAAFDSVEDELRGASLYTDPSREGFEGKDDPPPACSVVEPYRGHVFFGDCAGPQRFIVSHGMKDCSGQADGVGWRDVTATATGGSPTITGMSSMVGIQVGQIRMVNGGVSAGYIVSFVGTTLTMSQNQTVVGAAIAMTFVDAIQVDGAWHPLTNQTVAGGPSQVDQTAFEQDLHGQTAGKFAGTRLTPSLSGYVHTHLIEHTARNDTAFTLRATHGIEMSPTLPLAGATAQSSSIDIYPNMLMWSKQEEPEHAPPVNYVLVADKTKRILALCHTRDSLFIFKEDGIWRLSGYGGQWSIDPFDMTCFCLLPSSVRRLNNRIFMLSNQGIVAVSEDGVEPLSFPIADQTRKMIDDVRTNFIVDGYYHLSGISGVASTVDDRNSEYILLLGTTSLELNGAQALVYNELSHAWTTFSFTSGGLGGFVPQALGLAPDNTPLILHNGGVKKSSNAIETFLTQAVRRMYDGAASAATISSSDTSGSVVLSAPKSLIAGRDVLIDGAGTAYDIASVESTTAITVRLPDGVIPPAGTGEIRRGFLCSVQPHGFFGSVQLGKRWNALELGFSRLLGAVRLVARFSSAQPLVSEGQQELDQEFEVYRVGGQAAFHLGTLVRIPRIPDDHARAWMLRTRIMWLAVRGIISLELVQLDGAVISPNKPQQSSTGLS